MPSNYSAKLSIILGCLASFLQVLPSQAALPDQETQDFVTSRYHMLLEAGGRGGCSLTA